MGHFRGLGVIAMYICPWRDKTSQTICLHLRDLSRLAVAVCAVASPQALGSQHSAQPASSPVLIRAERGCGCFRGTLPCHHPLPIALLSFSPNLAVPARWNPKRCQARIWFLALEKFAIQARRRRVWFRSCW